MAILVDESLAHELGLWIEQGQQLRMRLVSAGVAAPVPTFGTLREAVDAALLEYDVFTLDQLRAKLRSTYPDLKEGSGVNSAIRRAFEGGKIIRLGESRYKVVQEWKRSQIPDG